MKSAIGIGSLLMDGLGDTIRVSLTEDPEFEIDPCGRCVVLGAAAWHGCGIAGCSCGGASVGRGAVTQGAGMQVARCRGAHAPLLPCAPRRLANLGKKADQEGWGVDAFEEHRDTHLFTRRCGQPLQGGGLELPHSESIAVLRGAPPASPSSTNCPFPAPPPLLASRAGWAPCPSSARATPPTTARCCTATAPCCRWSTPRTWSSQSEWQVVGWGGLGGGRLQQESGVEVGDRVACVARPVFG